MKRLALLLLLPFLFPLPAVGAHAASDVYAVAAARDVWFYGSENENDKLFLIPYSYYVRVLAEGETYLRVRYLDDASPYRAVEGYCRADAVRRVDFVPERPFLRLTVTREYLLPATEGYSDDTFFTVRRSFCYYGESYEGGKLRFYVCDESGNFGYLPASEPLVFDYNHDYEEIGSVSAAAEQSSPSPLQIVVICLACVAAVAVAVLVLRKGRAPAPRTDPEG